MTERFVIKNNNDCKTNVKLYYYQLKLKNYSSKCS